MNRIRRALLVPLVVVIALLTTTAPASAAQQPNANIAVYWKGLVSTSTGAWNVDQNIWVRTRAISTYWAAQFGWNNAGIGYMGVQTNGRRPDGSIGDIALFSVWNANGSRGSYCVRFSGEGSGRSCRIAYPIRTDRLYRLRLWRLETDAYGQWWGAWVKDQATGIEKYIGSLRAPRGNTLVTSFVNFTEYFGNAVAQRSSVPRSVVDFTQPAANSRGGGYYDRVGTYRYYALGSGANGSVRVVDYGWTRAARARLGGA